MGEGVLNDIKGMTLRQRREAKELSLMYVAGLCRVSHNTVRNWEMRKSRPPDRLLSRIAGIYGLTLGDLEPFLKPESTISTNRTEAV